MPTPWFLREEPLRGKPDADRLAQYKTYFRDQLQHPGILARLYVDERKSTDERIATLLAYLREHGEVDTQELVRIGGVSEKHTQTLVRQMHGDGLIECVARRRGNIPARWRAA